MAGVWDALGQGIQSGIDAFLRGKALQDERKRQQSYEELQKHELALRQFQARQGMEQYETAQSLAEQERARERHIAPDPRYLEEGFYIPMFKEISPGGFVPTSPEEREQLYLTARAGRDERARALADEELARQKELAGYTARTQQQYRGEAEPAEEPSFFFPNGEVNPRDASLYVLNWSERHGGADPGSDPVLREQFLLDIARMYPTIPDVRGKALAWLLQQPPPQPKPPREGPGFFQRLIDLVPGEPRTYGTRTIPEPITASAPGAGQTGDPARVEIEQMIRSMQPDMPEDMLQALVEAEYRKHLRTQPSGFHQAASATQQALNMPPALSPPVASPLQQAAQATQRAWGGR